MGGVAWSIGCINSGNVPLVLNAHIEEGLYKNLFEIYQPSYLCIPVALANTFSSYNVITERYGYILLETNLEGAPMHAELSHLLPTSGSTGSPKLVRHKYDNIEAAALNISTFFI